MIWTHTCLLSAGTPPFNTCSAVATKAPPITRSPWQLINYVYAGLGATPSSCVYHYDKGVYSCVENVLCLNISVPNHFFHQERWRGELSNSSLFWHVVWRPVSLRFQVSQKRGGAGQQSMQRTVIKLRCWYTALIWVQGDLSKSFYCIVYFMQNLLDLRQERFTWMKRLLRVRNCACLYS